MKTIIKQSADGLILSRNNNFNTNLGKVFINNHEITDIDTFFKVAEENTRLIEQVKKQKEVIDKVTNDLQQIIDNVKDRTIISLGQFIPKLEIIQDELNGSNDILKEVSE